MSAGGRQEARGPRTGDGPVVPDGAGTPDGPALTHVDAGGRARMVDVSGKQVTVREAVAAGRVRCAPEVVALLRGAGVPKGDALAVARLAGIQAAKRTSELIPLCHPLRLTNVEVEFAREGQGVLEIRATARAFDRTGVEMESLTAVSIAALTFYDMIKAVDRSARIEGIRLLEKTGGKSGTFSREES